MVALTKIKRRALRKQQWLLAQPFLRQALARYSPARHSDVLREWDLAPPVGHEWDGWREEPAKHWKCPACGWVHYEISLQEATASVMQNQPSEMTIADFEQCWSCGTPAASFVPAQPDDAPRLATLHPVLMQSVAWKK